MPVAKFGNQFQKQIGACKYFQDDFVSPVYLCYNHADDIYWNSGIMQRTHIANVRKFS
jgi:hypothetical protein